MFFLSVSHVIRHSRDTMEDVLEIYAPAHEELNPISREMEPPQKRKVVMGEIKEKRTVTLMTIPEKRTRKSRWDCAKTGRVVKASGGDIDTTCTLPSRPEHWRQMQALGLSGILAETDGQILVQKILYADACCGTSTPNWILEKIFKL